MWKGLHVVTALLLLITTSTSALPIKSYWTQRSELLKSEQAAALGGRLLFGRRESVVNYILMEAKRDELARGLIDPSVFTPSRSFFDMKKSIEQSRVFNLIKKIPKGAVLHVHDVAFVSDEYVFNITFRDNLYVCEIGNATNVKLSLRFFEKPNEGCDWKLVRDVRKNSLKAKLLNESIHKELSMFNSSRSKTTYENGNDAWIKANRIFEFLLPLLTYRPVWEDYYYHGLKEQYEDNVLYVEIRSTLPSLYELNGTTHSPIDTANIYKVVTERFVRDHPKFVGAKLIYAPSKTNINGNPTSVEIDYYLNLAVQLKREFPDFFAGFDFVGQEDASAPLATWVDKIRTIAVDVPFFFHAGETNWNGMSIDENLIDAILLNTTRIGHGFALTKHPRLMEIVKRKKIALEICPISNQIGMISDLRNHPATIFFSDDFPVVVSNDDPGIWGTKALSYDFYEAFMGIMSAHADIRAIKQLAINSIQYSSLNPEEKSRAMDIFTEQWTTFVKSFSSGLSKGE